MGFLSDVGDSISKTVKKGINDPLAYLNPVSYFGTAGLGESLGLGGFGYDTQTQRQQPLETPEQTATRRLLLQLATTGRLGGGPPTSQGLPPGMVTAYGGAGQPGAGTPGDAGLTLGEDLGLPSSNFEMSDLERQGMSSLQALLSSAMPSVLGSASSSLEGILGDPSLDPADQFEPFKTRLLRETGEAADRAKRESAFAGDLYSTSTIGELGDVEARGQEVLAQKMSDLVNQSLDRKVQAASVAPSIASVMETIPQARAESAMRFGGLPRNLENMRVGEERGDILRRRDEELGRVNALTSILGSPVQFGVPELTTHQPTALQELLNTLLGAGGSIGTALALRG